MGRAVRSIVIAIAGLWNLRRTSSWRQNLLRDVLSEEECVGVKEGVKGHTVDPCGRLPFSVRSACVSLRHPLVRLRRRDLVGWREAVVGISELMWNCRDIFMFILSAATLSVTVMIGAKEEHCNYRLQLSHAL